MKNYRLYIKKREGNKCFLCPCKTGLQVHHIKRRGAGGKHDYKNLITLCTACHMYKVHKNTYSVEEYALVFLDYTKQFTEPKNWKEIVTFTIKQDKEKFRGRISNKDLENNRQARKDYRQYQKLKFMETHDNLTPWQYSRKVYKERKEGLQKEEVILKGNTNDLKFINF